MGIEIVRLTKRFGPVHALAGIDLTLDTGRFQVLYGPNGAGKTTLLKILAGLAKPSSGAIRFDGEDLIRKPAHLRRRMGFLSHQPYLYAELTARENLVLLGDLYGILELGARVEDVLTEVGLTRRADDRVRTFSRGMTQRLSIARAMLHDPDLLLLDEPYAGLDPEAQRHLTDLLERMHDGRRSIVLTTHDLALGAALGDRIAIIAAGRVVFERDRSALAEGELVERYAEACAGSWA